MRLFCHFLKRSDWTVQKVTKISIWIIHWTKFRQTLWNNHQMKNLVLRQNVMKKSRKKNKLKSPINLIRGGGRGTDKESKNVKQNVYKNAKQSSKLLKTKFQWGQELYVFSHWTWFNSLFCWVRLLHGAIVLTYVHFETVNSWKFKSNVAVFG